jgi:hypothetical protein
VFNQLTGYVFFASESCSPTVASWYQVTLRKAYRAVQNNDFNIGRMKGSAATSCIESTHICAQINLFNSVDSLHRTLFSNWNAGNRDSVRNSISSSYTNRCWMRPSFSWITAWSHPSIGPWLIVCCLVIREAIYFSSASVTAATKTVISGFCIENIYVRFRRCNMKDLIRRIGDHSVYLENCIAMSFKN